MKPVCEVLRDSRIAVGLSQAKIAAALDISPSYVNDIEHGRRRLDGKYLPLLPAGVRQPVVRAMISAHEGEIVELKKLLTVPE